MKNNIQYYSHDCDSHEHRKFKKLCGRYNLTGEAQFWRLNNLIGKSDGCLLDIEDEDVFTDVADVLKLNFKQLEEFIAYLYECRLIYKVENKITTERCQETLKEVTKNRLKSRTKGKKETTSNSEESTGSSHENIGSLPPKYQKKEVFSGRKKIKKENKEIKGKILNDNSSEASPPDTDTRKYIEESKRKVRLRSSEPSPIANIIPAVVKGVIT